MARPKRVLPCAQDTSIQLTTREHDDILKSAQENGFENVLDYIRHLHNTCTHTVQNVRTQVSEPDYAAQFSSVPVDVFHSTSLGTMYHGDSRGYLFGVAQPKSVDLVMTSPPFGLVRKKSYGNEDSSEYCDWFRPFAEGCRRVIKDTGSLVIDIGGAWIPGQPTRSLYHFKLLIMLCEEYGFHLAQEHYWWNPSKLPTPAEWVNVRRVRVKDAVNTIWWLSPSPWPKASNRRVLAPYSDSMRDLLANGYTAKTRPSGHVISEKFGQDNGGSVPPNLLAIANTESSGQYQKHCRQNDIGIHPARFPSQLPEYFIRMLTDPGDLVVDPFGGSCVTGMVAEVLQRRWACVELNREYLQGALSRFAPHPISLPKDRAKPYQLFAPCMVAADDSRLACNGGATRPGVEPLEAREEPLKKGKPARKDKLQ